MHDLRRQDDEMWGPKRALDKKQIEDRMKASLVAKKTHQIMKWAQLILDSINRRIADFTASEVEGKLHEHSIEIRSHQMVREKRQEQLRKYMFALRSPIPPIDPDEDTEEELGDDEERVQISFELRELSNNGKVVTSFLPMGKKEEFRPPEETQEEKSRKQARADEWSIQTRLNNSMSENEVNDFLIRTWEDPRANSELKQTCLSLRTAVMSKTLRGSAKEKKFIMQADALRNRSEWASDKKRTLMDPRTSCYITIEYQTPTDLGRLRTTETRPKSRNHIGNS